MWRGHEPGVLVGLGALHDWLWAAEAIWACYIDLNELLPLLYTLTRRLLLGLAYRQRVLELFLLWLALLEGTLLAHVWTLWLVFN